LRCKKKTLRAFSWRSLNPPRPLSPRTGKYSSLRDGGVVDRIGLKAWRDRRRQQWIGGPLFAGHHSSNAAAAAVARGARAAQRPPPCLVHIIERSSPFSGADDPAATGEVDVHVVRSPKSGVNFFDLGDFDQQFDGARRRARPMIEQLLTERAKSAYGGGMTTKVVVNHAPPSSSGSSSSSSTSSGGGGGGFVAVPAVTPVRVNMNNRGVVVARRAGGIISGSAVRATTDDIGGGSGGAGGSS
jgi:hypothetical protein